MFTLPSVTVLLNLLSPLILFVQSIRQGLSPSEHRQRLGYVQPFPPNSRVLWIHGYSLGELTNGYNVLMCLVRNRSPLLDQITAVLFTTSTTNAVKAMSRRVSNNLQPLLPNKTLHTALLPLDTSFTVARFLDSTPLTAAVFIESDTWPILLTSTAERGIPIALLNARLSPSKSWLFTNIAPSLARSIFASFAYINTETDHEAALVNQLCPFQSVRKSKSLKFLFSGVSKPRSHQSLPAFRNAIGSRPVWVAASTHAPEEPLILKAHQRLRSKPRFEQALLIIAPRYPKRGKNIENEAIAAGFNPNSTLLRSRGNKLVLPETSVYIADTLGELALFYESAQVAFIGNSFARNGEGHNFAEAAHFGLCVVHGPNFGTFASEKEDVKRVLKLDKCMGGSSSSSPSMWTSPCMEAQNIDDLVELVSSALEHPKEMKDLGVMFRDAVQELCKATEDEVVNIMEKLFKRHDQDAHGEVLQSHNGAS